MGFQDQVQLNLIKKGKILKVKKHPQIEKKILLVVSVMKHFFQSAMRLVPSFDFGEKT